MRPLGQAGRFPFFGGCGAGVWAFLIWIDGDGMWKDAVPIR